MAGAVLMDVLRFSIATVTYYWRRSLLLTLCVAMAVFVPLTPYLLVRRAAGTLEQRAASTPLMLAAAGSKTDVTLSALYFDGRKHTIMTMGEVMAVDRQRAEAIPLHMRFSTSGVAIVGTTEAYYKHRGLELDEGAFSRRYGDCVLGAAAARKLGVSPGEYLTSDPKTIFNLTADYPLRIRVTGVLSPSDSPDDDVVFVSMETAWIMDGIGHGHFQQPSATDGADQNESAQEATPPGSSSEKLHLEITNENIGAFHFHGRREDYPVTACIIVPTDTRAETLLIGQYSARTDAKVMLIEPLSVIRRLLASVLRVRNLVLAGLSLVTGACILLVVFVFLLTFRLRQNEFDTLRKIGASTRQMSGMILVEMGVVLTTGATIGLALTWLMGRFDQILLRWLI